MLDKRADEATIAMVRHEMGLDIPLPEQYLNFVKGAVRLDFGKMCIRDRNSSGYRPKMRKGTIVSSKKDNTFIHGIGLKNVEKSVLKYNGIFEVGCENNIFEVKIVIFL